MSGANKDNLCNHNILQQKMNDNISNKSTIPKPISLKRTESKMDDHQQLEDDLSLIDGNNENEKWQYVNKQNKGNRKILKGNTSTREKTTTTTPIQSHNQTKSNTSYIQNTNNDERRKEEIKVTIGSQQMSNVNDSSTTSTNENYPSNGNEYELNNISQYAMKFAVEENFSIKIKCEPSLKTQNEASTIVKKLLEFFEKSFRKLNPRYNKPFGYDHFTLDKNGDLICYTKDIELFIFMCDANQYPEKVENLKIQPVLPRKLPARNAVILKFIDNKIHLNEVQEIIKDKFTSVYAIEEMMGSLNYRSRHIRVDLLSIEEYSKILNDGKIVIDSQIYEVDEMLPSPKILICSKCNAPGHFKRNCKAPFDMCKRCGNDKNDGNNHKECNIKCHHCGEDHEATNFKCKTISTFREQLLTKLKNNSHLLPPHIQFYIPQKFRDERNAKVLVNTKNQIFQDKQQTNNRNNVNHANVNVASTYTNGQSSEWDPNKNFIWNYELKKLQDELYLLKDEHNARINKLRTDNENHFQELMKKWQLTDLQIKTQNEIVTDICASLNDTLRPVMQIIQVMNQITASINEQTNDDNKRQERANAISNINVTINSFSDRLTLLYDHHLKIKELIEKQFQTMSEGLNRSYQITNEL